MEEDLLSQLQELFPNISVTTIQEKVKSLPSSQQNIDFLVDYFLTKEENENTSKKEEDDVESAMEMISLVPPSWEPSNKGLPTSAEESKKRKQIEEDHKLALQLMEDEKKHQVPPPRSNFMASIHEQRLKQHSGDTGSQVVGGGTNTTTSTNNQMSQLRDIQKERERKWKETKNSSRVAVTTKPNTQQPSIKTSGSGNYNLHNQLREVREKHKNEWRTTRLGRQRVWTISDIEANNKEKENARAQWGNGSASTANKTSKTNTIHTINNTIYDPVRIGKEALEFTNQFRKKNNLPPLKWHQSLYEIGVKHSKDMGDKKVPFGHQGFNDRMRQYPFPVKSAAENVAMNSGVADVARVAVEGWIDSPGHRKNLLSNMEWCGIGVYQNASGAWYLTQLFGL